MNRKQLTLLIVAGAVIVALGWMLNNRRETKYAQGNQRLGEKVIDNFPLNEVEQITIKQPQDQQLNLARKGDQWVVQERNGYPANFNNLSELLRKVWDLKVAQPVKVGASQLSRLELTPPGPGTNSGTLVEFKNKDGKVLHSLVLGKKHMREGRGDSPFGGGGWPDGRYIMVGTNVQTVAVVSEPFSNVEAKPSEWVDKEFLKVEKHKLIAVTAAAETNSWKLARESETNEWKLVDVKPGEQLDSGKSSSVTSALSWPSITDVATNTAPEATGMDKPQVVARLETFEGFVYDVKVGKKVADKDDYFLQVAVDANLVKERTPGKDEKPEDKAKLDKEFKDKVEKLEEKLKNEKALAKWTYIVPKYSIEPLLKERKDLLVEKKEEPKPEEKTTATSPVLPGTVLEPPKVTPAAIPAALKEPHKAASPPPPLPLPPTPPPKEETKKDEAQPSAAASEPVKPVQVETKPAGK